MISVELSPEGRDFLSSRDLHPKEANEMGITSNQEMIYFPYRVNGKLFRWKYRSMSDKKKMGFTKVNDSMPDEKMPFWNAQIWPTSDFLIVTEGELDAVAISQLGAKEVASLPNGASSVESSFKNNYEYLQRFDLIYICFDMDEAGNAAAEKAKSLLPPEKYRRIILPSKDANDWIKEHNPSSEDLVHLMRNAEKIISPSVVQASEIEEDYMHQVDRGASTSWKQIDQMLGGIRLGEVTTITADTGAGKTTFGINLLYNLLNNTKHGIWINSWEMDHRTVLRKIANLHFKRSLKFDAFTEKEKVIFREWLKNNNILINPSVIKTDIKSIKKDIEIASKVHNVKYILLDHLDYLIPPSFKDKYEAIEDVMLQLRLLCKEYNVHIFLIAHPKQTDGTSSISMNQIKGGSSIKQYSNNILIISKKYLDSSNKTLSDEVRVSIQKNRHLGTSGDVSLRYIGSMDGYDNWS